MGWWDSVKSHGSNMVKWGVDPAGMAGRTAMGWAGNKVGNAIGDAYNAMSPQDIAAPEFAPYQAYQADPNLLASIGQMQNQATGFMDQSKQFLDPNSAWAQGQQNQLGQQMGDMAAQQSAQMNQAMAQRGVGGGGMASLLGAANMNRAGEQTRQGFTDIMNRGLGAAQNYAQMAQAGLGNVGQLQAGIDANQFASGQGLNTYNQAQAMANYNTDVQNQNAQQAFQNSLFSMLGGAGSALGSMGSMIGGLASDRNMKENIEHVGVSPSGINIYEFDYKDKDYGSGRYRGVMAQEVPNASIVDHGVLKVDYSKTDVNFERVG